jgi:hypothetical protein
MRPTLSQPLIFLFDKSLNTDDKAELYATTEELHALRRQRPRHHPPRGQARGRGVLQHPTQRGSAVPLATAPPPEARPHVAPGALPPQPPGFPPFCLSVCLSPFPLPPSTPPPPGHSHPPFPPAKHQVAIIHCRHVD